MDDMSDKIQFIAIFSGVFCGLGIIFLSISLGIMASRNKSRNLCTAKAVGIVTDLVRKTSSDPRYSYWHPVIEFTTGYGERIVKTYAFGSDPPKYSPGQQIYLLYDPQNPQRILLPDDKIAKILTTVFLLVGIGLLVIGSVVGILVGLLWN